MNYTRAVDVTVAANAASPVEALVSRKGRALDAGEPASAAAAVFRNESVRVVPVLEDGRYIGAVDRNTIAGTAPGERLGAVAAPLLATVPAGTTLDAALGLLEEPYPTRLVVVDPADGSYAGIVCLRTSREALCLHAECHAEGDSR